MYLRGSWACCHKSNDRWLLCNLPLFTNSDIQSFEIKLMGTLINNVKYSAEEEILTEDKYIDIPTLYLSGPACWKHLQIVLGWWITFPLK